MVVWYFVVAGFRVCLRRRYADNHFARRRALSRRWRHRCVRVGRDDYVDPASPHTEPSCTWTVWGRGRTTGPTADVQDIHVPAVRFRARICQDRPIRGRFGRFLLVPVAKELGFLLCKVSLLLIVQSGLLSIS